MVRQWLINITSHTLQEGFMHEANEDRQDVWATVIQCLEAQMSSEEKEAYKKLCESLRM